MIDLRRFQKSACKGELAGTEEAQQFNNDTSYEGVTT